VWKCQSSLDKTYIFCRYLCILISSPVERNEQHGLIWISISLVDLVKLVLRHVFGMCLYSQEDFTLDTKDHRVKAACENTKLN